MLFRSGKRSPELNQAIGGARQSDHLYEAESAAVDFTVASVGDLRSVWEWIFNYCPHAFGQLIYYPHQNFIHVSLPSHKYQGEVFTK